MSNKSVTSILDENGKVRIEFETENELAVVRPVGVIDEDSNLSVIIQAIAQSQGIRGVQFDLGHVSRMNSCGVREWILLVERLSASFRCSFVNVNELIVEQANMIPGIFGKRGAVLSFHAPYFCESCSAEQSVLLKPADVSIGDGGPVVPVINCNKCSSPLVFDWEPSEYFHFIQKL